MSMDILKNREGINFMSKIERIKELTKELNQYRNEYYNQNKPSVNDAAYDKLFDELSVLEKETGFILSNSPTQTVGYEVISKLQKRTHPTPLKSLDKTKSIDELNKFKGDKEAVLMLKIDGLTVEVDYENGMFVGAYTRGNSEIGEDISHNALTFKNLPKQIAYKGKLRLCGEAIIHWDDFDKMNEALSEEEKYATPRNLTSGSVRQLDSKICAERNVYWYAFNILECEDGFSDSKANNFYRLQGLGFSVVPFNWIVRSDIIKDNNIILLKDWAKDCKIPYDGMVISYNSIEYSNSLGNTSHHPLHSLAFKEKEELAETILRSVEWNTTRSGQINPTAIFDTVILDNTEVSRASLFNLTFIRNMGLNLLNRISVSKRNLIIPYIEENLDRQDGNYMPIPEVCPSCGHKTEIRNTGTADFLFCTNDNCPAKLLDKFVNFVKRDAMNIEGLSEATLEKFINKGWLKVFGDIYRLEQYKNEIVRMEGFGQRSYQKLIEAINKSRNVKLENFLTALGIEGVGVSTGKLIAKKFKSIENFINAKNVEIINIEGIGDIITESICRYRLEWLDVIVDLMKEVEFIKEEKPQPIGLKDLSGMTFVITGAVYSFKNRDEFKVLIEGLNGKVSGSVSKKTNYLVCNEDAGSSKSQKAKALGVNVITEDEFNKMIGRSV